MVSVHSVLARLVAPFVTRNRRSARAMLVRFARAELGSSLSMRWAAARTSSIERRALYLKHALDEERHARFFVARARKLGAKVPSLVADADDLYRLLGETRFVAFVHRAEARGERELDAYRRSFRAAGDRKTAAVFDAVLRDERRHVEYSKRLLGELDATRATAVGVVWWESARALRRGGHAALRAASHVVLGLLYATLLPFALVLGLRRRFRRADVPSGKRVPLLER
jgi:rubrerythrin